MVVLQALSEYLVKRPPPSKHTLRVELHVPGQRTTLWNILPKMVYELQTAQVVTEYHELPDVYENSTCNGFQLDVSIEKTNKNHRPDVEMSYKLTIRVRALEREQRFVVLDIGLPTGFEPENFDLEQEPEVEVPSAQQLVRRCRRLWNHARAAILKTNRRYITQHRRRHPPGRLFHLRQESVVPLDESLSTFL
ncbi:complement C3-like protein [Labeo rohita]|uniref:Complement C3-like protein n=1 Tax=Labeo rohita TaxID=84645 RepID=A0A498LHH7_LABRO|nr:complement C3-like protein [Labeo rohita]